MDQQYNRYNSSETFYCVMLINLILWNLIQSKNCMLAAYMYMYLLHSLRAFKIFLNVWIKIKNLFTIHWKNAWTSCTCICITTNKSLKSISIFINTDNFIHNIFQIDNIVTFKLEPKEQYKSNQSSKSHLNF